MASENQFCRVYYTAGTAHLVTTGFAHLVQQLVSTDNSSKAEIVSNMDNLSHAL